jgi:hypothetical protein
MTILALLLIDSLGSVDFHVASFINFSLEGTALIQEWRFSGSARHGEAIGVDSTS